MKLQKAEREEQMASSDLTAVALHRFGLGAAPDEWARANPNPQSYVLQQITRAKPLASPLPASDLAIRLMRQAELKRQEEREAQAASAAASPTQPTAPAAPTPDQTLFRNEVIARFEQFTQTTEPLIERLVAFWSNHFAIAVNKASLVRGTAGAFEREAIRPHILGRFSDMLKSVAQHPTMLIYLDNIQSIGPNSRAAKQNQRGLNENLAREILELHTLGVDAGYSQEDVTSFARILTGWTMAQPFDDALYGGRFTFSPIRHEPGSHRVLGKDYHEEGLDQGLATLDDLAHHPATARHLCFKLARHFLADVPPPALVQNLTHIFITSDGDLGAVTRKLITAPEAWSLPLQKMRSPLLFMIALARAAERRPDTQTMLNELSLMGQPFWNPPGPNGFPDLTDVWRSPDNMVVRLDIAARWGRLNAALDPSQILDETLAQYASKATRQSIARAETRAQAISLLFMSPEFQHC